MNDVQAVRRVASRPSRAHRFDAELESFTIKRGHRPSAYEAERGEGRAHRLRAIPYDMEVVFTFSLPGRSRGDLLELRRLLATERVVQHEGELGLDARAIAF